jgi:hypothetical protein
MSKIENNPEGGQVLIFLLITLTILIIAALWQADLHQVLYSKNRVQHAGDSAAMAAARWQAETLNLIGDLNILQAVALTFAETQTVETISSIQKHLRFTGPLLGLFAAQQAAKNNGINSHSAFTATLLENASDIINVYPSIFPEPYPGCWQEYGNFVQTIGLQGIAAAPDNALLYIDYTYGHVLHNRDFYDAVAGRNWCWFFWYALDLLTTYENWKISWPPLPAQIGEANPQNSEYFSLNLSEQSFSFSPSIVETMNQIRDERNIDKRAISNAALHSASATWTIYDSSYWHNWTAFEPENEFPILPKTVKKEYNYEGADAVIRIEITPSALTPDFSISPVRWTAAAKPFGYLGEGQNKVSPNFYGLVLPCFSTVRLIPVDAASGGLGGAFDLEWRTHIKEHLPLYMEGTGSTPPLDTTCWYCQQLLTWEDKSFRQTGMEWIEDYSSNCWHSGGGTSHRGGTRRGH